MEYHNQQLGFASHLVPLVLSGEKTLTYRLGDRWNFLEPGDTILTKDSGTENVFAKLEILGKEHTTFGNIENDREGHESYQSDEERRKNFETYYKRSIDDSEPVTILGFKVVELIP